VRPGADQVRMQNGDHYLGKVVSLGTNTLVLKSDVLGTVQLPREKVAQITLGPGTATNTQPVASATNNQAGVASVPLTNGTVDLSASLRQLGANTNFIQQVQAQFLGAAGPEANAKFNEMVAGLMSGKLNLNDIRAEATAATAQLKELKRGLGDDDGWTLDGYLAILENFLQQTAPPNGSATNASRPLPTAKPKPVREEE
ncbi:MAG TPA: hypothetical protein VJW76_04780, partial [Verrucomicrobiae bacterium]|nr:hypothetical protein [Verrucomicrobiae bacterium]